MRDQINEIARTPEEVSKIEYMLKVAEEQSRKKVIKITRKPDPTKKFITLWRNRFHYGIHWRKPLYPFRLVRNVIKGKIYNIFISTNGYMFNDKRAKRCAELGVSTIYFCLDSGYPELHDLFRRKIGSFEKVMNGIKLCRNTV